MRTTAARSPSRLLLTFPPRIRFAISGLPAQQAASAQPCCATGKPVTGTHLTANGCVLRKLEKHFAGVRARRRDAERHPKARRRGARYPPRGQANARRSPDFVHDQLARSRHFRILYPLNRNMVRRKTGLIATIHCLICAL